MPSPNTFMEDFKGKFRFAFFTDKYEESCKFYEHLLEFKLEHSWDRNEYDKGSLFKAGWGLVEILKLPSNDIFKVQGLDYRHPQGAFMVIQVNEVDVLYKKYKARDIKFKQELIDQDWGHRSFSVEDPNGVVLLFIQDPFDGQ